MPLKSVERLESTQLFLSPSDVHREDRFCPFLFLLLALPLQAEEKVF